MNKILSSRERVLTALDHKEPDRVHWTWEDTNQVLPPLLTRSSKIDWRFINPLRSQNAINNWR